MPTGTRVRVGSVGQATGFALIRVELEADEGSIRAQLLSLAASKLGITTMDGKLLVIWWRGLVITGNYW